MEAGTPALGTLAWYVRKAFGEAPSALSEEYLRELRVNWREALSRARRSVFLMVLLSGLFVLLAGADISEIAFGGIKLTPDAIDVVATALPAIIAFLFAQYWELSVQIERYEDLHRAIVHQLHPTLSPLDMALHPPETNHTGGFELMLLGQHGRDELMASTSMTVSFVTYLAPFALIVGLYLTLLLNSGTTPITLGLSALASCFFLVKTYAFMTIRRREG